MTPGSTETPKIKAMRQAIAAKGKLSSDGLAAFVKEVDAEIAAQKKLESGFAKLATVSNAGEKPDAASQKAKVSGKKAGALAKESAGGLQELLKTVEAEIDKQKKVEAGFVKIAKAKP